ncbi:MAG: MotA/TolQ/ExbB proton channel family protein [Planctomycetota bacterium]
MLIPFRFTLTFVLVLSGSLAEGSQVDLFSIPVMQADAAGEIIDSAAIESIMTDAPEKEPVDSQPSGIDLLTLIARGGAFMIPIAVMSFLVVALAVERALMLRRSKIIPRSLETSLRELTIQSPSDFVSAAREVCHQSRAPAARVVHAMLDRSGLSISDAERAATEASQRELERAAAPVRWLSLAAAATPLMGLLGTVWGMIVAFHESTTLSADRSRSEQLSEGIYTALVTTLAGLAVAIPAAILALYLENRAIKWFSKVEELAFRLAPSVAEGKHEVVSSSIKSASTESERSEVVEGV